VIRRCPFPLRISEFEIEVPHDLGNDFGHLHQTNVLPDACPGTHSELLLSQSIKKIYRHEIPIHALIMLIIHDPTFRDELVDVSAKDIRIAMSHPAVYPNNGLSLTKLQEISTPSLNLRPARYAPPFGTTRAIVNPVAGCNLKSEKSERLHEPHGLFHDSLEIRHFTGLLIGNRIRNQPLLFHLFDFLLQLSHRRWILQHVIQHCAQ
jgi:hypothetical protein